MADAGDRRHTDDLDELQEIAVLGSVVLTMGKERRIRRINAAVDHIFARPARQAASGRRQGWRTRQGVRIGQPESKLTFNFGLTVWPFRPNGLALMDPPIAIEAMGSRPAAVLLLNR